VPVGLISFIGLRLTLPADRPTGRVALDWTGFLSLSVAIACVQLVLSRGQRLDWFDSAEILIEAFVACAAAAFWWKARVPPTHRSIWSYWRPAMALPTRNRKAVNR